MNWKAKAIGWLVLGLLYSTANYAQIHLDDTAPLSDDSDGDGFTDGVEVSAASDPNDALSTPSNAVEVSLPLWIYSVLSVLLLGVFRTSQDNA